MPNKDFSIDESGVIHPLDLVAKFKQRNGGQK